MNIQYLDGGCVYSLYQKGGKNKLGVINTFNER